MEKTLQLEPWLDLNPIVGDATRWTMSIGPDGEAYVAIALDDDQHPFKLDRLGNRDRPPQRYRIVTANRELEFVSSLPSVSEVQPLPEGLLVVSPRAALWAPGDPEMNAEVYSPDGILLRRFCLGDGILHVQAEPNGRIWTGYFDEGVYGNYGWGFYGAGEPYTKPLGSAGLIQWDSSGIAQYEFVETTGLEFITDCYALNVVTDDEVWLYYYDPFDLVRLESRRVTGVWKGAIRGSGAFAVDDEYALFADGYGHDGRYPFYRLSQHGTVEPLAELMFEDKSGEVLGSRATGRADSLFITAKNKVYRVGIAWVLGELGIS
jgi:hypothetical protein